MSSAIKVIFSAHIGEVFDKWFCQGCKGDCSMGSMNKPEVCGRMNRNANETEMLILQLHATLAQTCSPRADNHLHCFPACAEMHF